MMDGGIQLAAQMQRRGAECALDAQRMRHANPTLATCLQAMAKGYYDSARFFMGLEKVS